MSALKLDHDKNKQPIRGDRVRTNSARLREVGDGVSVEPRRVNEARESMMRWITAGSTAIGSCRRERAGT
jgi:hypothetical protein